MAICLGASAQQGAAAGASGQQLSSRGNAAAAEDSYPLGDSSAATSLLFRDWVPARVESHNPLFANDSLLFNYDKLQQALLATTDKKNYQTIGRREFQRVTFFQNAVPYTFEHVPEINGRHLFQVLVEDSGRYCLYKYTRMYVLSTYVYRRLTGRRYFDYNTYYIVFPFPDAKVTRLIRWNKKMLRHAFVLSGDIGKVDAFYSAHSDMEPGEAFLRGLVEYLDR